MVGLKCYTLAIWREQMQYCLNCLAEVPEGASKCPECGQSDPDTIPAPIRKWPYYQDHQITVTLTHLSVQGRSHSLSSIESASVVKVGLKVTLLIIFILSGLSLVVCVYTGYRDEGTVLAAVLYACPGIFFLIAGGLLAYNRRGSYAVRVVSSWGERNIVERRSKENVEEIAKALNRAIRDRNKYGGH
jgi:hypothetical protein